MESIREININLDLYRENYNSILLKQFDNTKLNFNIFENGAVTDLSNSSFVLNFKKNDNTVVIQTEEFDTSLLSQGKVSVELDSDCLRAYGESNIFELQILKDEKMISSFEFPVTIRGSIVDSSIGSEDKITLTEELNVKIKEGSEIKSEIEQAILDGSLEVINSKINSINLDIGNKSTLSTTNKTSLVNAINENVVSLSDKQNQINTINATLGTHEKKLRTVLDEFSGCYVVAHKGLMNLAPENTIPAFELAGKYRYKVIEFDVSTTSDGIPLILHDSTIDAMTNGTGTLSTMTYSQSQTYTIDAGANVDIYNNLKLPTLDTILRIAIKYNFVCFIELKNLSNITNDCLTISNMIKQYGLQNRCVITSAWKPALEAYRQIDKTIAMGLNVVTSWDVTNIDYCKQYNIGMIGYSRYYATADNINLCHANGLKFGTFSPTGTGSMDLLSEEKAYRWLGVDFIMTGSLIEGGVL